MHLSAVGIEDVFSLIGYSEEIKAHEMCSVAVDTDVESVVGCSIERGRCAIRRRNLKSLVRCKF